MKTFNLIPSENPVEFGNREFLETYTFPNGKPFPESYKRFVNEFGYGVAMGEFLIYIPMDDYGDSWNIRTEEIKETYYEDLLEEGEDFWGMSEGVTVEILKRLVPFSSSENGYYLFWDPESGEENEFDIYITDFRGVEFAKAGTSLYDIIEKMTGPKHKDVLLFSEEPLPGTFRCLKRI